MANSRPHPRGLTLIEVLLALVLLAALAAISIGIFRDASAAVKESTLTEAIDQLARYTDLLVREHSETLGKLAVGQSWRSPLDAAGITAVVTREPCEDCPEGWARLSVSGEGVSVTRFHRVDPRMEHPE
ncbi:MAG: prepilin-type N-terminal cleavage/methylation domain-containing protein [Phycisphaerales bacterium]|nr:prepilin-type N-terminal cleavage/methylation domain-containing protein [Phycisphaerales bacterium]MCB9837103.1 prepilin-type N-terminal cleavage/methylation domain-containing protein [Phycisphaera sp.]